MNLTTLPVLNLAHYHSATRRDAFPEQMTGDNLRNQYQNNPVV